MKSANRKTWPHMREHTHVWLKSPFIACRFLALAKKPKINQRGSKIFAQKCIFLASYLNESARSRDQGLAQVLKVDKISK